jgi:hypothetical protein
VEGDAENAQRTVFEDGICDIPGGTNTDTGSPKAKFKFLSKSAKQVDMLALFLCKTEECLCSINVVISHAPQLLKYHRDDKFLNQREEVEVAIASDLVKYEFLLVIKTLNVVHPCQGIWQEGFPKIEQLVSPNQIFYAPVNFQGIS